MIKTLKRKYEEWRRPELKCSRLGHDYLIKDIRFVGINEAGNNIFRHVLTCSRCGLTGIQTVDFVTGIHNIVTNEWELEEIAD